MPQFHLQVLVQEILCRLAKESTFSRPLPVQFAVELALRAAQFAREALESFFFVDAGF